LKKWTSKLNRQFPKEELMAKKYMKKCAIFLAIKKMQIKMTLRFHFTPGKIGITNNITINAG
jgi:hypothetical protein